MNRPEPDKDGMIPCDCCRGGYRTRRYGNGKPEKILCQHCKGKMMRKAPKGYKSQKEIDEMQRKARKEHLNRLEDRKNELRKMTLEELIELLIEREVID